MALRPGGKIGRNRVSIILAGGATSMQKFPVVYRDQISQEVGQTPDEYLPMFLQIVRSLRQSVALRPVKESFCQGWEEVRAGETLPISDFFQESPLAREELDLSRDKSPIRSNTAL
jgi:hypothetical protein